MSQYILLPQNQIFKYVYTGKFKALSDKWKHERFPLKEFELITLTEGELYITYQNENYEKIYSIVPKEDKVIISIVENTKLLRKYTITNNNLVVPNFISPQELEEVKGSQK